MDTIPYYNIPQEMDGFEPGNILSRMIDGLGYRYHWASKNLRSEDLSYKPSLDASDLRHTLDHIYQLSVTILNVAAGKTNIRPMIDTSYSYPELRQKALNNFKEASDFFKNKTAGELSELKIIFKRGDAQSEFPLWNLINGQIADALYHTGQVVSFRRTTGNPLSNQVNVFTGKTRKVE